MFERKNKEDIVLNAEMAIEKREELLRQTRLHRGHTMWEYCIETGEIKPAEFSKQTFVLTDKVLKTKQAGINRKLVMRPGYLYAPALNLKNARKVFQRTPIIYQVPKQTDLI